MTCGWLACSWEVDEGPACGSNCDCNEGSGAITVSGEEYDAKDRAGDDAGLVWISEGGWPSVKLWDDSGREPVRIGLKDCVGPFLGSGDLSEFDDGR